MKRILFCSWALGLLLLLSGFARASLIPIVIQDDFGRVAIQESDGTVVQWTVGGQDQISTLSRGGISTGYKFAGNYESGLDTLTLDLQESFVGQSSLVLRYDGLAAYWGSHWYIRRQFEVEVAYLLTSPLPGRSILTQNTIFKTVSMTCSNSECPTDPFYDLFLQNGVRLYQFANFDLGGVADTNSAQVILDDTGKPVQVKQRGGNVALNASFEEYLPGALEISTPDYLGDRLGFGGPDVESGTRLVQTPPELTIFGDVAFASETYQPMQLGLLEPLISRTVYVIDVPEPHTLALLGLAALAFTLRRRKQ